MTKLYMITGFLGAGKTTFLKNFMRIFEKQRMHIIVNEYGKEGIDGKLLKSVGTVLDEINNGSIFCSCRLDKFEEVLAHALSMKPDVILIEASGLSNPTNVRKIMAQKEKFPDLEYRGSICLVDAKRFHKVYQTAKVVKNQIAVSDIVLLNKIDLVTDEEKEEVKRLIFMQRPDMKIFETSYGKIETSWISEMKQPPLTTEKPDIQTKDITLRSYLLKITDQFTAYELDRFVNMFLEDTYRVKGFVKVEGKIYLLDCVGNLFQMKEYKGETAEWNQLVVLAGNGLPTKRSIQKAIEWYPDKVEYFIMTK